MNSETYCNIINSGLARLVAEVRQAGGSNLRSINIHAEGFFREFLNLLFGWSLTNANAAAPNAAGVDLLYPGGNVAVQVSGTTSHEKIQSSLDKSARYEGAHFYFIAIDDHLPDYRAPFDAHGLTFDPGTDILDTAKLYERVVHSEGRGTLPAIDIQRMLSELVDKYFERVTLRSALKLEPLGRGKARSRFEYNAGVVPLLGRAREMADLRGFVAGDPRPFAWWAVAGPGGAGKTRLAFELQEALLEEGEWDVGVIPTAVLEKYEQQEPDISDACPGRTLLIVDYVQRYTGALALLLRRLSDPAVKRGVPLRLLLLERDVRDEQGLIPWWEQLRGTDHHVREACFDRNPMVLAPMAAPEGAADPLETLIRDFADALCDDPDADCPTPHRLPEGKETDLRQRLEDIDPGLLRPLIAMILADAWVRDPETEHWTRDELLSHIVDREWDMVARRLGDFHTRLLPGACRIVWMAATVLSAGASPLSCDRLPALLPGAWEAIARAADQHAAALESWTISLPESLLTHAGLLTEGLVQPLRPDLLGEYFVLEGLLNQLGKNERSAFYTAVLRELDAAEVFFSRMLDDYAGLLREHTDRQAKLFPESPGLAPEATADYSELLRRLFERSRDSVTRGWLCARLTALAAGQETQNGETARICHNAGTVLFYMGDYPRALEFYEKDRRITEAVLGTEHPDTATTYNNMAIVFRAMGDYPKALEFYEKDRRITEAVLGTEHPDTAASYNNMANVFLDMGDYPKALEFYGKALKIKKAVLGPEHPNTASTYEGMAIVYSDMGDYPKALEYYEKALKVKEAVLGPEHPDMALSYNNMAAIHAEMGDYPKALKYFEKSLKIGEAMLGPEHPDTARTYFNLALLYFRTHDLDNAVHYSDQALEVFQRVLGPAHPYTVKAKVLNELLHKENGNDV